MSVIAIERLARVEGHGGITVEMENGRVAGVRFDVFEGARLLEPLVRGRRYDEATVILSRICAICSSAHTLTSLKAAEAAFCVEVSPQTELLRELMFRGESIESHALHLFLLAIPDYLNYPSAIALSADHPAPVLLGLRIKRLGNLVQETIGGRAVHPVNCVPGGFGRPPEAERLTQLRAALAQGIADSAAALDVIASLPPADFCRRPTAYAALRAAADGYYSGEEAVVVAGRERTPVRANDCRAMTNETSAPHSHARHSTFRGRPFMVGALARLAADSRRLSKRAAAAVKRLGLRLPSDNPMDNNKAQAVELLDDVARALEIVDRLLRDGVRDEVPAPVRPRAASAAAMTEAPRGLLIHSYTYDARGRVEAADVITPTALNAASIEERLRAAAEQCPTHDEDELRRRLQMVARAYDPCISCSVHLVRRA